MRGLAAVLVGTAVGALVRPPGAGVRRLARAAADRRVTGRGLSRLETASPSGLVGLLRRGRPARVLVVPVALVGLVLGARLFFTVLALGVITGTVLLMRSQRRQRAEVAARRARVIESCGVLAADLRAGRAPQDALESAASVCPELRPAAAAARLGGEVGDALEQASMLSGAGGIRALGAAWRVSERSGAALATIAERLAAALRADESVRRQVSAGLGGTRATARLLAGLPVLGTLLGYGIGADPLAFLMGSPIGWMCLSAGLALGVLGLVWVERLAVSCEAS